MTKRFRPWDPKQKWLLPPEITEFIPEGHPAHFVRDLVVDELDLGAILDTYVEDKGNPPFQPAMMVALGHVALDGTKVIAEWQMVCTGHNLLKLARASG
jgi:transposase